MKEISYKDGWNLKGYRNASIDVPAWFIVSKDGLIIDIEGFLSDLFGHISPPDESIYNAPTTIHTSEGETWRMFGRHVLGGSVIVAICSPDSLPDADMKSLCVNEGGICQ